MFTYQNILNNNVRSLKTRVYRDKYYDFMLYRGEVGGCYNPNETDQLIADFSDFDIKNGILYSTAVWKDAVNDGVEMEDIGFTGIDNGLIHYKKDRITNEEFFNIITNSVYTIDSGDTRFFMTPITGNTGDFIYPMEFVDEKEKYISFKGGFYQGFYKLYGFNYQTLPNGPEKELGLYFQIRPRTDYEVDVKTINHIHPENNGIFFYMGTRAENKFSNFYKLDSATTEDITADNLFTDGYLDPSVCGDSGETTDLQNHVVSETQYEKDVDPSERPNPNESLYYNNGSFEDCVKNPIRYFADDYVDPSTIESCNKEEPCPEPRPKPKPVYDGCSCSITSLPDYNVHISELYEYKYQESSHCCDNCKKDDPKPKCSQEYFDDDYLKPIICPDTNKSIEDEYFQDDIVMPDENQLTDSFGHIFAKKGYYEITTDNKFLIFDRTCSGRTVHNWVEGTKVTLTGRQDWSNINYFPIMNRTCTGYTVHNIYEYNEKNSIPYDIYKDIKNNSFALRINEKGAIGYRYAVLDCNADNVKHFAIEEEYSKEGIIKMNEWNTVYVRIINLNPTSLKCDTKKNKRKMKLYFYVNGFLVFISKELDLLNFRALNDVYQKQEAVPYNVSLGGGTQGLLETILPDYYKDNQYILPIEKNFCGSFLGDIKSFKVFNGLINFCSINNYLS